MYPETDAASVKEKAVLAQARSVAKEPQCPEPMDGNSLANSTGGVTSCGPGCQLCHPRREDLHSQVKRKLAAAREQSRKTEVLAELQFLLERNPEIARILDLVEIVRG